MYLHSNQNYNLNKAESYFYHILYTLRITFWNVLSTIKDLNAFDFFSFVNYSTLVLYKLIYNVQNILSVHQYTCRFEMLYWLEKKTQITVFVFDPIHVCVVFFKNQLEN